MADLSKDGLIRTLQQVTAVLPFTLEAAPATFSAALPGERLKQGTQVR